MKPANPALTRARRAGHRRDVFGLAKSKLTPEPRARRGDVFTVATDPRSQRGQRGAYLRHRAHTAPGVDSQGRFIGRGDVDRGFTFFLQSRGQSPAAFQAFFGGEFGAAAKRGRPLGSKNAHPVA